MRHISLALFTVLLFISCLAQNKQNKQTSTVTIAKDSILNQKQIVYSSDSLIIEKLSDHVYLHTSFLQTKDFGKVDCNGMIVVNKNEAIVFDTPADNESSGTLIRFVTDKLRCRIKAIIPTHFHDDCVGGLDKFMTYNIPVYASNKTIALLKTKDKHFSKPIIGFDDSLTLTVANQPVQARYFGEGHTRDNIIGYFKGDNVIFGGCLIKTLDATKGNLEDANVSDWSATVKKIKQTFPNAAIVIPGHGQWGGIELLDYTMKLFEE